MAKQFFAESWEDFAKKLATNRRKVRKNG